MTQRIRKAKISEYDVLSQVAFDSKSYWGYSPEFMEACRAELTVTPEKISSKAFNYFVYEFDNEIRGFTAIEKLSENEAELEALFVKPNHIGSGIGKSLMKHALEYAKSSGYHSLFIQGDPHAENFYLAAGAKRIGTKESVSIEGRQLPVFSFSFEHV